MYTSLIFATLLGDGGGFRSNTQGDGLSRGDPDKQSFLDSLSNASTEHSIHRSVSGSDFQGDTQTYWDAQLSQIVHHTRLLPVHRFLRRLVQSYRLTQLDALTSLYAFFLTCIK